MKINPITLRYSIPLPCRVEGPRLHDQELDQECHDAESYQPNPIFSKVFRHNFLKEKYIKDFIDIGAEQLF